MKKVRLERKYFTYDYVFNAYLEELGVAHTCTADLQRIETIVINTDDKMEAWDWKQKNVAVTRTPPDKTDIFRSCYRHKNYKGNRPPTNNCEECWRIYLH